MPLAVARYNGPIDFARFGFQTLPLCLASLPGISACEESVTFDFNRFDELRLRIEKGDQQPAAHQAAAFQPAASYTQPYHSAYQPAHQALVRQPEKQVSSSASLSSTVASGQDWAERPKDGVDVNDTVVVLEAHDGNADEGTLQLEVGQGLTVLHIDPSGSRRTTSSRSFGEFGDFRAGVGGLFVWLVEFVRAELSTFVTGVELHAPAGCMCMCVGLSAPVRPLWSRPYGLARWPVRGFCVTV